QRISRSVQEVQHIIQAAHELTDSSCQFACNRIRSQVSWASERVEVGIDSAHSLDHCLEIGYALDSLAPELLFPAQGGDDLAQELGQPGLRSGLVNRDWIGP